MSKDVSLLYHDSKYYWTKRQIAGFDFTAKHKLTYKAAVTDGLVHSTIILHNNIKVMPCGICKWREGNFYVLIIIPSRLTDNHYEEEEAANVKVKLFEFGLKYCTLMFNYYI